jgi:hypothetical protein
MFAALERLDAYVNIDRAWENIRENRKLNNGQSRSLSVETGKKKF